MSYAIQWLRSLFFVGQMYVALLVVGLLYLPAAIMSRRAANAGCHAYCAYVQWSARWMIGLRTEEGTAADAAVNLRQIILWPRCLALLAGIENRKAVLKAIYVAANLMLAAPVAVSPLGDILCGTEGAVRKLTSYLRRICSSTVEPWPNRVCILSCRLKKAEHAESEPLGRTEFENGRRAPD